MFGSQISRLCFLLLFHTLKCWNFWCDILISQFVACWGLTFCMTRNFLAILESQHHPRVTYFSHITGPSRQPFMELASKYKTMAEVLWAFFVWVPTSSLGKDPSLPLPVNSVQVLSETCKGEAVLEIWFSGRSISRLHIRWIAAVCFEVFLWSVATGNECLTWRE